VLELTTDDLNRPVGKTQEILRTELAAGRTEFRLTSGRMTLTKSILEFADECGWREEIEGALADGLDKAEEKVAKAAMAAQKRPTKARRLVQLGRTDGGLLVAVYSVGASYEYQIATASGVRLEKVKESEL